MAISITANPTGLRKLAKVLSTKQLELGIEIFQKEITRQALKAELDVIQEKLKDLDGGETKPKAKRKTNRKPAAKKKPSAKKKAVAKTTSKTATATKVGAKKKGATTKANRTRGKQPAKYELKTNDGNVVQWSGFGRKPGPIKAFVDAGGALDSLKIRR